jgi:hypothetical protein
MRKSQRDIDPDEPDAKALWRYRAKLVDMLDDVSWLVGNAPQEMQMPRESIQYLLRPPIIFSMLRKAYPKPRTLISSGQPSVNCKKASDPSGLAWTTG